MLQELPSRALRSGLPVLLALYLLSPLLTRTLDPNNYVGGRSRDVEDRARRNSSAVAQMLGEVRTSMSDMMFIKTERYLHSGIAYVPQADVGSLSIQSTTAAFEEQQEHEHAPDTGEHQPAVHTHADGTAHPLDEVCQPGRPTVIKQPEEDFRGFIGHLHRAVKPWQSPDQAHKHGDGIELLPWFRVMTLSDPHYVRGYSVGSWWLKRRDPQAAWQFAEEGLRHNPEAFSIHYIKGQLQSEQARKLAGDAVYDPPSMARFIFMQARDTYAEGALLALQQRPPGGSDNPDNAGWSRYMEDDAFALCRMAVLTERQYGDPEKARAMAREYLARLGADAALERLAQPAER